MKKHLLNTLAITAVLGLPIHSSLAQDEQLAEDKPLAQNEQRTKTKPMLVELEKIEEATVWDFQGNEIGEIEEILIDPQKGRISYAVVEVEESWGWDDREVIVPFAAFDVKCKDDDTITVALDADQERLKNAPKAPTDQRADLADERNSEEYNTYWQSNMRGTDLTDRN